jgi:hypothetical protein
MTINLAIMRLQQKKIIIKKLIKISRKLLRVMAWFKNGGWSSKL